VSVDRIEPSPVGFDPCREVMYRFWVSPPLVLADDNIGTRLFAHFSDGSLPINLSAAAREPRGISAPFTRRLISRAAFGDPAPLCPRHPIAFAVHQRLSSDPAQGFCLACADDVIEYTFRSASILGGEAPVWVRSAVPHDCPARQEYPNDRTRRPAKAASPSGQLRSSRPLSEARQIGVTFNHQLPTGRAEVL
jgi:hypothetical protein